VLLKRNTLELTENQLATIKNKLATFFNNKFNLTTAKAELIEIIK